MFQRPLFEGISALELKIFQRLITFRAGSRSQSDDPWPRSDDDRCVALDRWDESGSQGSKGSVRASLRPGDSMGGLREG